MIFKIEDPFTKSLKKKELSCRDMQYSIDLIQKVKSYYTSACFILGLIIVLGNDVLFITLISENHLEEYDDHVEVNGVTFNKPFVEKPISAEDHNIYMYYPTSAGTYHKVSIKRCYLRLYLNFLLFG